MVAGDKRRSVEDAEPIDPEDLALICEGIESERDACLLALLYLSGRRINEVLPVKKQDFKIEENRISFETFNEKDYRQTSQADYTVKRYVKQVDFKGRKSKPYEGYLYYRRIRPHWRTDISSAKRLSVFILRRLGSLRSEEYLFKAYTHKNHPIGRQQAYLIVRFHLPGAWLHLFRHERFTEIAKVYQDNPVAMHRYTYHKRFESTLKYIRDLEEERI